MTILLMPKVEIGGITMAVLFGIVQGFTLIYFFSVKKRFEHHRSFVFLVAVFLIGLIESFLTRSGIMARVPHLLNIFYPFVFLFGPLTYKYVLEQLNIKSNKKSSLLHYLPFVFYFIYSFNFFLQSKAFKYNIYIQNYYPEILTNRTSSDFPINSWEIIDPWQIQGLVLVEILVLHMLIYAYLSFYQIIKYSKKQPKRYKERENWVTYTTGILTLSGLVLFFSHGIIIYEEVYFKGLLPHYFMNLFSTLALYLFTLYLLSKPAFFKKYNVKYKKSSLSNEFKKEKLKQLKSIIEKDKLYLNSNFSLRILSEKSGLNNHHISQILNEELQCTFFKLTNDYRINEAKLWLEKSDEFLKMEQLAFDLGYKSKSTFFTAFKKATNLTPLKYRESNTLSK